MSEPLREKVKIRHEYGEHTNHEYLDVETFDLTDVRSAWVFYKKYRGFPYDLMIKEPKAWKEYCKVAKNPYTMKSYDWWLYDYCFEDVTE